tara:strand:+ start:614 stop:1297 length:684 start_codon:yes stop_codon:yes gene_type:complete
VHKIYPAGSKIHLINKVEGTDGELGRSLSPSSLSFRKNPSHRSTKGIQVNEGRRTSRGRECGGKTTPILSYVVDSRVLPLSTSSSRALAPGECFHVLSSDGKHLGVGAMNMKSKIRLRMWTYHDEDEEEDSARGERKSYCAKQEQEQEQKQKQEEKGNKHHRNNIHGIQQHVPSMNGLAEEAHPTHVSIDRHFFRQKIQRAMESRADYIAERLSEVAARDDNKVHSE